MRALLTGLHYFPDRPSGSVRLAYDEARALLERGHEVWFVTQQLTDDHPEYQHDDGLHVLRYQRPASIPNPLERLTFHQRATEAIITRHARGPFDLVRGHALLQYRGAMAALGEGPRYSYSIHSPALLEFRAGAFGGGPLTRLLAELRGRLVARVEGICLRRSHHITSDSDFTRRTMGRLYGPALGDRVEHQPAWVDTADYHILTDRKAARHALVWEADTPIFFTLRRLVPRNGVSRLVEATAILRETGHPFRVVIGGRGPLLADLQAQSAALGVDDLISFVGFLPESNLPTAYAAADAFVLPTARLECFGLIILESFAAGTPVIGTPVGAIPEIIAPLEPGWVTKENSAASLAQGMASFLNGDLPTHTPQALRDYAKTYDRSVNLAQMIDRLEAIANHTHQQRATLS